MTECPEGFPLGYEVELYSMSGETIAENREEPTEYDVLVKHHLGRGAVDLLFEESFATYELAAKKAEALAVQYGTHHVDEIGG